MREAETAAEAIVEVKGSAMAAVALCSAQPLDARPLLAILGIHSHTGRLALRDAIRATWLMKAPNDMVAKFVMRGEGDDAARQEAERRGDVVVLDKAPAHAGPRTGPLISTLSFLQCALQKWPRADAIGHAEDDTYIVLPGVAHALRKAFAGLPPASDGKARMLWGWMEMYHWSNVTHAPNRWWSYWDHGSKARDTCHTSAAGVIGPFGFAKGALYFLSSHVVSQLTTDDRVRAAADAALAPRSARVASSSTTATTLVDGPSTPMPGALPNVWEDVFIGYALSILKHEEASKDEPLHFVSNPNAYHEPRHSVGLSATAATLIVHSVRNKSPDALWALHRWKQRHHCQARNGKLQLSCASWSSQGCGGGHKWRSCFISGDAYDHCDQRVEYPMSPWAQRDVNGSCAWHALNEVAAPSAAEATTTTGGGGGGSSSSSSSSGAVGFCAPTNYGGDCDNGDIGAWNLPGPLSVCVAMCACCARCKYVSFSAINQDCSWHNSCDMTKLSTMPNVEEAHGTSYTTVAVTSPSS